MSPLRYNHLYWFPLSTFLADELCSLYLMLWTVAPADLYTGCHFMSPLSFLLLLLLLMHIPVDLCTWSLVWLALCCWRIAHRKSNDRHAMQRQSLSCSLPLHVVHSELSDSHVTANMEEKSRSMLSAPAHCPELCGTVHLQTMPLTFPFYSWTNQLEWIGMLIKI